MSLFQVPWGLVCDCLHFRIN